MNRRLIEDQGLVLVSSAEQWRLALSLRCFWMGSYCTSEPISKTPAFLILPLTGQKLIPEIVQLTLGWGTPTPQIGAILSSPPLQVLVRGILASIFRSWPTCGWSYSRVGQGHPKLLRRKLLVLRRSHQSWKFLYQLNPGFSHNARLPALTPYDWQVENSQSESFRRVDPSVLKDTTA